MVDLSTLKVGDTVRFRDGQTDIVMSIRIGTESYPYILTLAKWGSTRYTTKGESLLKRAHEWDIVQIIPAVPAPVPDSQPSVAECAASTEALRFNSGKTPYGNLPLDLLDGAARVMAYGANKYGDSENFRKGYSDLVSPLHSLIRHVVDLQRAIQTEDTDGSGGFLLDKESNEGHIHHVLTSAIILLHSMRLKGYKV